MIAHNGLFYVSTKELILDEPCECAFNTIARLDEFKNLPEEQKEQFYAVTDPVSFYESGYIPSNYYDALCFKVFESVRTNQGLFAAIDKTIFESFQTRRLAGK